MKPRPLGESRTEREHAEDLAEFVGLLLDALDIPEVVTAVRARLGNPERDTQTGGKVTPRRGTSR